MPIYADDIARERIAKREFLKKITEEKLSPQKKEKAKKEERHKRDFSPFYRDELISVIIPNRVGEKNESLYSVKNQTYKNIEIIEVFDEGQNGAAATRNEGLKKAKGEYIFFCDNDLELEPDCLENLYKTLQENEWAGWAFGKFFIDGKLFNEGKRPLPKNKYTREFIDYFHGVSTMSLIRAKCEPFMDKEMLRFDDWDLWIRLTRDGHFPVFCNKVLFKTKNRPTGISVQDNIGMWKDVLYNKHLKKLADIIIPHHNRHDHLKNCLDQIDISIFNIIVRGGGSFAHNCNQGVKSAETNDFIFLNDDTIPKNDLLIEMALSNADIVGATQQMPKHNNLVLYGIGYKIEDNELTAFLARTQEEVHFPSGFCFKVKKKAWEELGGLNEEFKNGGEDIDFGLKAIERKYRIEYIKEPIIHFESQSEGRFNNAFSNNELLKELWGYEKTIKLLNL